MVTTSRIRQWLSVALAVGMLVGCGRASDTKSHVKVSNGKDIAETEYPAVILLFDQTKGALCTGTFISDTTVITAAHCTMGSNDIDAKTGKVNHTLYLARVIDIKQKKLEKIATSVAVYRNPQWDAEFKKQQVNKYDLGVVVFPAGTARGIAQISSDTPAQGDELTIVGYGLNYVPKNEKDIDVSSVGKKRLGHNSVAQLQDGFIYFSGAVKTTSADGSNANASMGDSGGPMFINDKLVGITSGGGRTIFGTGASVYIDLSSDISKDFLRTLKIEY